MNLLGVLLVHLHKFISLDFLKKEIIGQELSPLVLPILAGRSKIRRCEFSLNKINWGGLSVRWRRFYFKKICRFIFFNALQVHPARKGTNAKQGKKLQDSLWSKSRKNDSIRNSRKCWYEKSPQAQGTSKQSDPRSKTRGKVTQTQARKR